MRNTLFIQKMIVATLMATGINLAQATDYYYTGNGNGTAAGSISYQANWYFNDAGTWKYGFVGNASATKPGNAVQTGYNTDNGIGITSVNAIHFVSAAEFKSITTKDIDSTRQPTWDGAQYGFGKLTISSSSFVTSVLNNNTSGRSMGWNAYGDTGATQFEINKDFTLGGYNSAAVANSFTVNANVNMTISTGSTFTLSGGLVATDKIITVSGGGTLAFWNTNTTASHNSNWVVTGGATLNLNATAQANTVRTLGTGTIGLDGGTLKLVTGNHTLANVMTIGAGGGTITGASSVILSGAVTAANYSTLTLESDTTFTQNAVLYNVNLGTGATIVLSGATNSIANVNGAAGLGNTVSLAAGSKTTLTGFADNVTFEMATGAALNMSLEAGRIRSVDPVVDMGDFVVDATGAGAIINVTLTDSFLAQYVGWDEWSEVLTTLTLDGLKIASGDTVKINLISLGENYVLGDNGTWSVDYVGNGANVVLGGGVGGQGGAITLHYYIPEPTTATLGVLGLAGLLLRRRRKA